MNHDNNDRPADIFEMYAHEDPTGNTVPLVRVKQGRSKQIETELAQRYAEEIDKIEATEWMTRREGERE